MKNKKVKAILAITVLTIGVGATIAVGAMSSKSEPVVENTVVAEEVVELEEVASDESDLVYFDTQEELDENLTNEINEQAELRASASEEEKDGFSTVEEHRQAAYEYLLEQYGEEEAACFLNDTEINSDGLISFVNETGDSSKQVEVLMYLYNVERLGVEGAEKLAAGETLITGESTTTVTVGESTLVGGGSQPTGWGGLGPDQLPLQQHDVDVSNAIPHTAK